MLIKASIVCNIINVVFPACQVLGCHQAWPGCYNPFTGEMFLCPAALATGRGCVPPPGAPPPPTLEFVSAPNDNHDRYYETQ